MGAPSDQFIHLIWRPRSLCIFLGSFLCILYRGSQITFFAYYMGPLRSVSSHIIWGPLSDHFHCLLYAPPPPQISFFACYRGATSDFIFFTKYMPPPPRSVSPLTIWGPLRLVSLLTIWGPLRSVSVHTFWGPLSDQFFLLLYGAPSDRFFRILYGGPLRSVSSPSIWGSPEISFFAYYIRGHHQISFFAY